MNSFLRESGVDWLSVIVPRSDVEGCIIAPTLNVLQSVLADSETVRLFQGRVDIAFEGWDSDPRELYEILEVRTFMARLDEEWPYWLYFLSTERQALRMIAFCLCHARRVGSELAQVPPDVLALFLMTHFSAVNELFAAFGLDESMNVPISKHVAEYFR